MNARRTLIVSLLAALLASGCSSLPGLRVLSGQDSPEAIAEQNLQTSELVMADKTGATDPSLMSAADRAEAASGDIDIIEIRQNLDEDTFSVSLLFQPPQGADPNTTEGRFAYYDSLRRAIELTWQATLDESSGSDTITVNILSPQGLPTLDNGISFIGQVALNTQISRDNAITYLSSPHTLEDFVNLIADGTMSYAQPEGFALYEGTPNHPIYMLPSTSTNALASG